MRHCVFVGSNSFILSAHERCVKSILAVDLKHSDLICRNVIASILFPRQFSQRLNLILRFSFCSSCCWIVFVDLNYFLILTRLLHLSCCFAFFFFSLSLFFFLLFNGFLLVIAIAYISTWRWMGRSMDQIWLEKGWNHGWRLELHIRKMDWGSRR